MFFKKHILFLVLALILSSYSISQNQQIPLHTYFKQQSLKFSSNNSIDTYYPIYENQLNLTDSLKDNKVFYYDLFVWLVKKNWVDIVTPEGKLSINPLINLSLGSAKSGSVKSNLYRNTRGVSMSGELYKKTSF